MADNGKQLMVVDGNDGYTYSFQSEAFGRITDRAFPGGNQVVYQDGYFVITPYGTGQLNVSSLYNGRSWDSLDFASAEGNPDNIVSLLSDHRELWLFGSRSTEAWYNAGSADFPFLRVNGSFGEKGCAAPWTAAKLDNSVFWLTHENQIARADGYRPIIVSTQQMDFQIAQFNTVDDAFAFAYVYEGHPFYQITFPSAGKTWVLDMSTMLWHERSSWSSHHPDQQWQHRANCYAWYDNKHLVGDYRNGCIYEMSGKSTADHESPIKKEFTIIPILGDDKNISHASISLNLEYGKGAFGQYMTDTEGRYLLDTDQKFVSVKDHETGTFPNIYATLDYSDDGGWNWDGKRMFKIGQAGKYWYRAKADRLGISRERTYRITCTDPASLSMTAAHIEGEQGRV